MKFISSREWSELAMQLENHHAIFYKLWFVGQPTLSDAIPTAAVEFDKTGNYINFIFNPKFWNSLGVQGKLFCICHEMLHIILSHGKRTNNMVAGEKVAANICLDLVVNHTLINGFGFSRDIIESDISSALETKIGEQCLCWVDTIFKSDKISDTMHFEYYYNLYKEKFGDGSPMIAAGVNGGCLDDHGFFSKDWDEFLSGMAKDFSNDDMSAIKNLLKKHGDASFAGIGNGMWIHADPTKIKQKRRWETVIKSWERQHTQDSYGIAEQWLRVSRSHTLLERCLFMPSEVETYQTIKSECKIDVFFFMDTSGSCISNKDRFFSAAGSLSKSKFNTRIFCFDTEIKETSVSSRKIYGGGGTNFFPIDTFVRQHTKDHGNHPSIFVLTDGYGYGDTIRPLQPKKWNWFITRNGTNSQIDKICNIFMLEDFI